MSKPKLHHTEIETIQEVGADLKRRRIYLFGDVGRDMSWKALTALDILAQSKEPITVILNSGGGEEYQGWAIYDAFQAVPNKIKVIAYGQAMSMAAILLQVGDERLISKNLRFMIHNGSTEWGRSLHAVEVRAWGKEQERNDRRYAQVLAQHARRNIAAIERACEKETFLTAEEAVAYGFADAIYQGPVR